MEGPEDLRSRDPGGGAERRAAHRKNERSDFGPPSRRVFFRPGVLKGRRRPYLPVMSLS